MTVRKADAAAASTKRVGVRRLTAPPNRSTQAVANRPAANDLPPAQEPHVQAWTVDRCALELARWAQMTASPFLTEVDVPGATARELACLSAMGAVVSALGGDVTSMPQQVRRWAAHAQDPLPPELLTHLHGDAVHEMLAGAYELIVAGPNRRVLGTFFTPSSVVTHMVDLCADRAEAPHVVVDPGAGVGAFTRAALQRWPKTVVKAVDVNPVTLGLLTASVTSSERTRLHMELDNYLTWSASHGVDLSGPMLVLGNPPYTRHQHMSAEDKRIARRSAGDLVDSGLAGLSTYFAAATLKMLKPGDTACLLLPGNWCQARYGRPLRAWLWSATHRLVRVQQFPATAEIFPGTQVTAMVLFVGPQRVAEQPMWFDQIDLADGDRGRDGPDTVRIVQSVMKDRREPCPAVFAAAARRSTPPADSEATRALSEVARIRRGVATGVNKFFFLTDDDAARFPPKLLRPALVKASQSPGLRLDKANHDAIGAAGGRRWLLSIPENHRPTGELATYLHAGEEAGYSTRYLTQHRRIWFSVEKVSPPDLFIAPFARQAHRVIVNDVGAVGSNNLYGIYLAEESGWQPVELAQWLLSDEAVDRTSALGRAYQGRSHKLEPGDLATLRLPRRSAT